MTECFICLYKSNELLNLNSQNTYRKCCKCSGTIHKECLEKWYETNNKCPICRIYVKPKTYSLYTYSMTMYYLSLNGFFFTLICAMLLQPFLIASLCVYSFNKLVI